MVVGVAGQGVEHVAGHETSAGQGSSVSSLHPGQHRYYIRHMRKKIQLDRHDYSLQYYYIIRTHLK